MSVREILIIGGAGQLGIELQRCTLPNGWLICTTDRHDLDLADPAEIAAKIAGHRWAAVINAAAYTAVDKAESEVVAAWQVNALAPAALGEACARAGIPLIHVSTDYVFAGGKTSAWAVDDPVGPLGVYGASKLGGELAVRTSGARHVIVRTSWLVSAHRSNFIKTMLRAAGERDIVRVVDDQRGCPTGAADLARALMMIAIRVAEDEGAPSGTFHFSNRGAITWAGFASEIFRQSDARGGPAAKVEPINTAEYPTPARRPANSVLDTTAISEAYGIAPRPWTEALDDILNELIGVAK